MSNGVSVNIGKIQWNQPALNAINKHTLEGLFRLGFDIATQARKNAPYVTGALRSTIRVQETADADTLEVRAGGTYGGKVVNYAWKREQGPNRNPATEHYMENAQKQIMNGDYIKKYFGDITK